MFIKPGQWIYRKDGTVIGLCIYYTPFALNRDDFHTVLYYNTVSHWKLGWDSSEYEYDFQIHESWEISNEMPVFNTTTK